MCKNLKKSLKIIGILGAITLTGCANKIGDSNNGQEETKRVESETTSMKEIDSTTDYGEEELGWVTHGGLSIYVSTAQKRQLTNNNEIIINQGGKLEDGCYIRFEKLKDYVSYKDVKKDKLWGNWFINMSDGELVEYVDGDVGRSIYYMDERIPFGETETTSEPIEIRHYYNVVWGTDESDVVAILSFPYEYDKEDVDKVIAKIKVKKA